MKAYFLSLIFLLFTLTAFSQLTGTVVRITDGDTFTLLTEEKQQVKVRLNGIDCPEAKQDFGQRARQYLSELIFQKDVVISETSKDRYGRTLGTVHVGNINVNETMVSSGMAWHYKQYSKDERLGALENEARDNKKGLWSQPNPTPPWDYRKK